MVDASTTDTTFTWVCDWQYQLKINSQPTLKDSAARFALVFMVLDRNIFGHTKFDISDNRLFKHGNKSAAYLQITAPQPVTPPQGELSRMAECYDVTASVFIFCPYPNTDACMNGCDRCHMCMSTVSDVVCFSNGGGGGGGGYVGWMPPHGTGGEQRRKRQPAGQWQPAHLQPGGGNALRPWLEPQAA